MATITRPPTRTRISIKGILAAAVVGVFILVIMVAGAIGWAQAYRGQRAVAVQRATGTALALTISAQEAAALAHEASLAQYATEVTDYETLVSDYEAEALGYQADLAVAATQEADLTTAAATVEAQLQAAEEELAESADLVDQLSDDVEHLESLQVCSYVSPALDYSSNAAMSRSIENWLGDVLEEIEEADWTVLWEDEETAYHALTGASGAYYVYVVYFGTDRERSAVFDVFGSCWVF